MVCNYCTPTIFLLGPAIPCKKSKFCLTAELNISEKLKTWLSLKLNACDKSVKRNVIILIFLQQSSHKLKLICVLFKYF